MKTGNNSLLLDNNIVIDLFRGKQEIAKEIDKANIVYLPIFALGELYFGAENSGRSHHQMGFIDKFLEISSILNTSDQTALIYGRLKKYLKTKGTPIPENDIWIGSLALEHELPLVTRDHHFDLLPEIQIISW
ncbi:type II toxin-antitoxin system VapC family toxin [Aquiflexum sp.]|uniref:type II toxin-antitoxin system VapC family toxin n=1 Tax=Aquiflexum sp. TaxID=1872584 RepID=UPI0035947233